MLDINDSLEALGNVVDVATAAAWLNLDGTEPAAWLGAAVDTGNAAFLDWLGWDPRSMDSVEIVDSTGGRSLMMSRKKITAINSINLLLPGNTPVPQNLQYFVADQTEALITSTACYLPRGIQNVQVDYTAGYTKLPAALTQGVLYTIKAVLDASGVDFNATGESYSGVLSRTFWPGGPGVVPPSAKTLCMRYQIDI